MVHLYCKTGNISYFLFYCVVENFCYFLIIFIIIYYSNSQNIILRKSSEIILFAILQLCKTMHLKLHCKNFTVYSIRCK